MNKGDNYVFVGGVPRSGTSIFQKILDGHPKIYGGPEFDHLELTMNLLSNFLRGIESNRQSIYYDETDVYESFSTMLDSFFQKILTEKNAEILSEKTPSNVLVFKDLVKIFPEAKFIWVIRDPRSCLNSYQKVFANNHDAKIGRDIVEDVNQIREYIRAGEDFCKEHKDKCFVIYYEDFISKPEEKIREVCNFLNVEFHESMIHTDRESDMDKLINKGAYGLKGYINDNYAQKLSSTEINRWKEELSRDHILYIDHHLAYINSLHLNRYGPFKKRSTFRIGLFLIKEKGFKEFLRKMLE